MPQMTLIVLFSTLSRVIDEQLASNRFAKQLRRRRSNRNRSRKHQDENCASPAHAFSTHLTSLAPPGELRCDPLRARLAGRLPIRPFPGRFQYTHYAAVRPCGGNSCKRILVNILRGGFSV